ncbi:MAG: hypothetical protein DWQ47_09560 [Acidobacteria bacterium]|nr:MAG: hypothetical protein DWQ32_17660 [Acidobacteriota bacterium]REJ98854.1 MAG: hypothetical protein DWQ38_12315 [Acidobacteriota bacterium]REK16426.1 MAG: hypothetical protein DWQ43_05370 [Acidobacteriota bacterium]REK44107.1 MAG: hypothetical protein DWQ47_09560 [Acidobacteriota bacterium]
MNHGSSGLILLAVYLALAAFLLPLYSLPGSETDLINRAAAASLVENTSFDISRFEEQSDVKFSDVRRVDGAVYPDSPPGFAVASAPFYAIVRLILGPAGRDNLESGWLAMRLLLASLPVLLLGIWLFSSEVDAYSLAILLFATPLLPLSFLFTSYVFVAVLVYLAFRVIFDFERVMPGRCFTAGVFLGFCLMCDLRSVLPIAVFLVGLLFTGGKEVGTRILCYLVGVIPFAAAIGFYSWWLLGSPLEIIPTDDFKVPTLYSFFQLWISPAKGLFFYSPVLLFSLIAVVTTKEGGTLRFGVKYSLVVLALVLAVFWRENGIDQAVPAASLAFTIPMLLDPLFDGEADEYPSIWRGLFFALSLLLCSIPLFTYPFSPAALSYPHNSLWWPLIFEQMAFTPNIVMWFGFESPWLILVPALAVVLVFFAVIRTARYPARFAAGALVGVLLVGAYVFTLDLEPGKAKPVIDQVSGVIDH